MKIGSREIGESQPTYFIADIAANHDGDLERALNLITLAADAGADAAKFQHFRAEEIVSDKGFRELGGPSSHQATWEKSVFETYQDASLPWDWTITLAQHAREVGIDFFTSPYDLEAIDYVDQFVPAFKVGSGDITWLEAIEKMASKGKPVLLATGASSLEEVQRAVEVIRLQKAPLCVMQCNTNYTGDWDNFRHINLRVLPVFAEVFEDAVLGLSDHTPGHSTVLGAVALGARVIEKHFTDDVSRPGPDHHFSLTPDTWADMVQKTREVEAALGAANKEVAENERETVVLQRRALRFARAMQAGERILRDDLVVLRPAPSFALAPDRIDEVIGKSLRADVEFHDLVTSSVISS